MKTDKKEDKRDNAEDEYWDGCLDELIELAESDEEPACAMEYWTRTGLRAYERAKKAAWIPAVLAGGIDVLYFAYAKKMPETIEDYIIGGAIAVIGLASAAYMLFRPKKAYVNDAIDSGSSHMLL
ncbi:MAG: hypothetical protein ABIJ21_01820 [Nanoarchaeota archaeon]